MSVNEFTAASNTLNGTSFHALLLGSHCVRFNLCYLIVGLAWALRGLDRADLQFSYRGPG